MSLHDVQRIVDKISKEVEDDEGQPDTRQTAIRVYNMFAINLDAWHDENGRMIVETVVADYPIKEWKKEEELMDFRAEINGKPVEELEVMYIATPEEEKRKRDYLNLIILRQRKGEIEQFSSSMSSMTNEELQNIVDSTGEDWKSSQERSAARAFLQSKEIQIFEAEAKTKTDEELSELKASIRADDVLGSQKLRAITLITGARLTKKRETEHLSKAAKIARDGDEKLERLRAEYDGIRSDTDKETSINRLQWAIDVAKGKIAQSRLDGVEPEISGDVVNGMEADLRLIKAILLGVKKGVGYDFSSFYETSHPTDICPSFPVVNNMVFTTGDDSIDVLVVDHVLTDYECILVARDADNEDEVGINKVLKMLEREDLIYDKSLNKHRDEDDEDDDEDDGDDSDAGSVLVHRGVDDDMDGDDNVDDKSDDEEDNEE